MKLKAILLSSLFAAGTFFGQQPAPKPFELTHYEKRIPADAWMLFSMDFNVFLKSREYMKAVLGSDPGGPPAELVDLMTSGKLNVIMPYPILFGVGGDASKPGNATDQNPAVIDFLKSRHQFGGYFNLSAVPDEIVQAWYKDEGEATGLTEAEVLEVFTAMKKIVPPFHGGMDFEKGQIAMRTTVHDANMAAKWPGEGVPKELLDAIPADGMMVLSASLNLENANDDIALRLGEIFKLVNTLRKATAPEGAPGLSLEDLGKQLDAAAQDAVGLAAQDLLKIFKGDIVLSVGMEPGPPGPDGEPQPMPSVVLGVTVKDDEKAKSLIDFIKAQELLPDGALGIAQKPGLLFLCTPNLTAQLEKGAVDKPLAGNALKAVKENHLAMYVDLQKALALGGMFGQEIAPADDAVAQEMLKQLGAMVMTGKFADGKLASEISFRFRDPKMDTMELIAKFAPATDEIGGAAGDATLPGEPVKPVDPIEALADRADAGDPEAMHQLGVNLWHGRGMPKNELLGANWFGKAAAAGHSDAQYMMGVICWLGRGAPKDFSRSYYWLSLAAAQKHADGTAWKPKAAAQLTQEQRDAVDTEVADALKALNEKTTPEPEPDPDN